MGFIVTKIDMKVNQVIKFLPVAVYPHLLASHKVQENHHCKRERTLKLG